MYALITGASSGCGYEYARQLAAKSYDLLIVSNEASIHDKAQLLRNDFGVQVISLQQDLGTQNAAKDLYNYCQEQQLDIEVIINNAGVYHDRDFMQDSEAFNLSVGTHGLCRNTENCRDARFVRPIGLKDRKPR
jgi:short-subunit dehydrogenase